MRAKDAIMVSEIAMHLDESYGLIADGVINRNVAETKKGWLDVKATAQKDIEAVRKLSDTTEEKALAEDFAKKYKEYLNHFETETLPILEKENSIAKRAQDALSVKDIQLRVEGVYPVAADAILNRKFAETRRDLANIKVFAQKDIEVVKSLADTAQEKTLAEEFAAAYSTYLRTIEEKLLPALEKNTKVDEAIRDIDEKLDGLRDAVIAPLLKTNASISQETQDVLADEAMLRAIDEKMDNPPSCKRPT